MKDRLTVALAGFVRVVTSALPRALRETHAAELASTTDELVRFAQHRGRHAVLATWVGIAVDAAVRLPQEHLVDFWRDLRFAARGLARARTYAIVSTLCLALSIGLAVSIYGQLAATVFRSLPHVDRPDELVLLSLPVSYLDAAVLDEACHDCEHLAAFAAPIPFSVGDATAVERAWGHVVSHEYFATLGVTAQIGHLPDWSGGRDGASLVISHRFWQRRFGGRADIIGRAIDVNGRQAVVSAVLPRGFLGALPMLAAADLWVSADSRPSLAVEITPAVLDDAQADRFRLVARLRPGTSVDVVERGFIEWMQRRPTGTATVEAQRPRAVLLPGGRVFPLDRQHRAVVVGVPAVLTVLTLWIACASVAVLLLARTGARGRELAIRRALGATTGRLSRQILAETMLLTGLGAGGGLLFAYWSNTATGWLTATLPSHLDLDVRLRGDAVIATIVAALLAGAMLGLPAARQATRGDILPGLTAAPGNRLRRHRWMSQRNLLVLQQVAASVMLLLITGLVALGFSRLSVREVGFDPRDLHVVTIDPLRDGRLPDAVPALLQRVIDRLTVAPGVVGVSLTTSSPIDTGTIGSRSPVLVTTRPGAEPDVRAHARVAHVDQAFGAAVRLSLRAGRWIRCEAGCGHVSEAVVNRTLADRHWPDGQVLGQMVDVNGRRYQVTGVVDDVHGGSVFEPPTPMLLLPQIDDDLRAPTRQGVTVLVRLASDVDAERIVRQAVGSVDARLTVFSVKPVAHQLAANDRFANMAVVMYASLGAFGLLLAVVGLAGVTAYATLRRTRELGIRVVLGAGPPEILRLVMREAAWLTIVGTALGVVGALLVTRGLGSWFEGITRLTDTTMTDPALMLGVPAVLALLTLLASAGPARRAVRIDPLSCLREG